MTTKKTRRKAKEAPDPPFVERAFLYRVPFVFRDRLSVKEGALELVHPARMSHVSTDLAIEWLGLVIKKLKAMASDEVATCMACSNPAIRWEREPELRGFCKDHLPEPNYIMSDEHSARRW